MILNVIYFSIFIPLSLQGAYAVSIDVNKPLLVKAAVDSARIIGLPSSKAAKAYAQKIQAPDPIIKQITVIPEPISDRQLFFRNYFK
jgi:hypothetical protein